MTTTTDHATWFRAIALDYDGTLTNSSAPAPEVLSAIELARAGGLHVILVTGRILSELREVFADVEAHVDAIVGENGAVLSSHARVHRLTAPVDPRLAAAISQRGVPVRVGSVLLACHAGDEPAIVEEVRRLGLECQLVRNRTELMVLPAGVTKATGLRAALAELGLSPHSAIAMGDAENDHSLLDAVELGVAVGNAVPALKEHADVVLGEPDGAAVAGFLDGEIVAGRVRVHSPRWRVTIGTHDDAAVTIPASQVNVLIAGDTGAGKSYLAGLIAEQLVELGYGLLVMDPEGDHLGLAQLPGVIPIAGNRHLPHPASLAQLLSANRSVVLDLSELAAAKQRAYIDALTIEVEAQRRATGLPHWVVIDEAQHALGRDPLGAPLLDPAMKGHCLVTWRAQDLTPQTIADLDIVVATCTASPTPALVDLVAAIADVPPLGIAESLATASGRAVIASRLNPGTVGELAIGDRFTAHFRHEHKYNLGGIPAEHRFFFRSGPAHPTGVTAGNLTELEEELAHCPRDVLRHHAPRHDLSAWVEAVFHDSTLARELRSAEDAVAPDSPAAVVESARRSLIAAVRRRHTW